MENMLPTKWDIRFIRLAREVATWSSCCRHDIGAVIIDNNKVIATGYNGAPAGIISCRERGYCYKNSIGIENGPTSCYAVHAEQNALIQAAKHGTKLDGSTLYCTFQPCNICAKMIINAGIKKVIYENNYNDIFALALFKEANIGVWQYSEKDNCLYNK